MSAAKLKIDHLEDDLAKNSSRATRDISRLRGELENVKAERDILSREKRDADDKLQEQTAKLQLQLNTEEAKLADVQRVC